MVALMKDVMCPRCGSHDVSHNGEEVPCDCQEGSSCSMTVSSPGGG